jgi:TonB family protein
MSKFHIILFLILLFCNNANGQRWISGQVTSADGEPIIGAVVTNTRIHKGVRTDIGGNYRIEADSLRAWLRFSHFGYEEQEIRIENDSIVNIVLIEEHILLDEFIINAFGDLTRRAEVFRVPHIETIRTRRKIRNFRIQREVFSRQTTDTPIGTRIEYVNYNTRLTIQNFRIQREFVSREVISSTGPTIDELAEYRQNLRQRQRQQQVQSFIVEKQFAESYFQSPLHLFLKPTLENILENINYPEQAIYYHIQGRVRVRFIIDLEGSFENVEIIRDFDPLLDNEVLSAFQSVLVNGVEFRRLFDTYREHPHPLRFILPVTFRLNQVSTSELEKSESLV